MNGVQIRVGDLLYAIGKRWKMILAFVLVGCGFGAALSGISYVQGNYTNYRINCSIAVTSQSETGNFTGNSSYFNPNDFYLAQDMVDAVGYVMKSERVLREAAESVRIVDPDPVAIARNLDIERYNETQIIEISLKWHDADTGIRLMNAILDTSREVLPKTLMVGSVSTIDEPQAEYIMGMGGLSHIWLITGVMGFIMGAGMAMLELIMRPTLLNLKDVENVFGLETMGIIPNDQEYFRDGRVILEKDGMTDSAVRQNFTSAAYILQNRLGLKDETCSFYVTSAEEGEGKSTVAANLAVQLSDMEKKVLLVDLGGLREAGLLLVDGLRHEDAGILGTEVEQERRAVLHHRDELFVADPGGVEEDVVAQAADAVDHLTGVVDRAVVGAELDDGEAERALFIGALGCNLADELAQVLLVEAVVVDAADEAVAVAGGLEVDGRRARLNERAVMVRLVVVAVEEHQIARREKRVEHDLVGGGGAVEDEVRLVGVVDLGGRHLGGAGHAFVNE